MEKTKRYGDTTDFDFLNNSADDENSLEKRQAARVASFSPTKDMPLQLEGTNPVLPPIWRKQQG